MNRVTLKQLADILGLSTGTVSKALKDYYDISPETKRRVKELAEKLNYVPNALAVNFRTKETKTIGLIIPEVVHHFFSNVIKGIIEEAEKLDYLVIVLPSNESFELEKKQLNLLVSKQVDGIIMSLANKTIDYKHINAVIDKNIPVILFDKISKLVKCSKIIIDDRKAAYNATNHLIKTGCKKIAHIRGPLEPQNSIDRFLGYKKALDENNIEYISNFVYTCDEVSFEEGYQFAEQIIKDHPDIDGIFAITDLVATGVITKLNELNIKIPEQISVIGFSDWFLSRAITPSLTTIYQPGLEIGKNCFSQLIKEIQFKKNNTNYNYETITLPTSLIVRNSTKTI